MTACALCLRPTWVVVADGESKVCRRCQAIPGPLRARLLGLVYELRGLGVQVVVEVRNAT